MAESRHGRYVRQVQEATTRHAQALLAENERLRAQVAVLEARRSETERRLTTAEKAAGLTDALRALAARLESDKISLQRRLDDALGDLAAFRRERAELEEQLARAEDDSRRAAEEYAEVEQRSSHLANLYVASYRLHETIERDAVVEAIQEIIINLIGSEEFGIFEFDAREEALPLTDSFGIDPEEFAAGGLACDCIARAARSGDVYVAPSRRTDAPCAPIACIPLRAAGRVTGVIAVFQLLAHKPDLEPIDHELFDLLATQAGAALHCSQLQAAARTVNE